MRLILWFDRLMAAAAALLIAATAVVTCVAVFFRSVVGASLPWPEEVTGNLLVWTSFVGAYLASRGRGHIAFDLFVEKLPGRLRKAILTVNDVLLVGFFGLLLWLAWKAISVVGGTSLETLPIAKGWFMAAIPFCAGALILAVVVRAVERWRSGDETPGLDDERP